MANGNENQDHSEDRQSEFDQDRKPSEASNANQQPATGQQSGQPELDQQDSIGGQSGQQSEYGQSSQAETSLADRTGQQAPSQSSEAQSADSSQSGGFVGSESENSGEYLQQNDQSDFAEQGHGALDEGEDIERGSERSADRSSDIEGSSDNR